MPLHRHQDHPGADQVSFPPLYAHRNETRSFPKFRMPDEPMDPDVAMHLVHDELLLDGSSRLNLATFVTTWMEPHAAELMAECADKNMIDKDEYPQTAELERRCIHMLADLWHAPGAESASGSASSDSSATGCSTTGSSEAAMLAGMAMKWRWRARRGLTGTDAQRPNLVMGTNVQVCWEKFCRYWDVEPRYVPMVPGRLHLGADEAVALCDEDTIGVVAVLGSTQDGSYEPVADIAAALDRLAAGGGPDVPVHVDAASGGFIAPFLDPELSWDFAIERVCSINSSGHKYGLVYPGVGWVLWRTAEDLPDDLVFHVNYLGGSMPTFALNFSRPGAEVVAQYYMLIRLGFDGYRAIQGACREVAKHLVSAIPKVGPYEMLSDGTELPVFVFKLRDDTEGFTVFDVSDALRKRGWQVPAYTFPDDMTDTAVLRVVVRNGFGRDLADLFLEDLKTETAVLGRYGSSLPTDKRRETFHH